MNRKRNFRGSKRFIILIVILVAFALWRLIFDLIAYLKEEFSNQYLDRDDNEIEGYRIYDNIGNSRNIFVYLFGRPNYYYRRRKNTTKLIVQFTTDGADEDHYQHGKALFNKCPHSDCLFTNDINEGPYADLLLFFHGVKSPPFSRPANQIWSAFLYESPYLTSIEDGHQINWTISFSRESSIYLPYVRFVPYKTPRPTESLINYYRNKTDQSKLAVWIVSNCNAANDRLHYAQTLARYISVDVFGNCGKEFDCPRGNYECFYNIARQYRFYLAFENSNCKDYITEKLQAAITSETIPIVMGARPSDYQSIIPNEKYFIHVENFSSPKQLAKYLVTLAENEEEYNSYFTWRLKGKIIRVNPLNEPIKIDWCLLCSRLHDTRNLVKSSSDIKNWWSIENQCVDRWRNGEMRH